MASRNEWLGEFQQYDFDDAYFNDVASNDARESNDDDWMDSECDSEKEVEFNLVNPIVGEMYAYMQWHFNKQQMRTNMLTCNAYMDKLTEGNPLKCYEMFHMTRELPDHLVDELTRYSYLRDE